MATILVVDDSPSTRHTLIGFLEAEHEVIFGEDGIDAVWHFKHSRPDAVLLDLNMPVLGGLDALRLIKSIDASARVAILTGERDQETVVQARAGGALDFVIKPYTSKRIAATLRVLLPKQFQISRKDDQPAADASGASERTADPASAEPVQF